MTLAGLLDYKIIVCLCVCVCLSPDGACRMFLKNVEIVIRKAQSNRSKL